MDIKNLTLDERAQCAAYLRAHHNMSQAEIGNALGGLSQPNVSRLLALAQKKKYLAVTHRFAKELFSDEWLKQMDELLVPPEFSQTVKRYCLSNNFNEPRIRVFESGTGSTEGALGHRRNRFGRTAAGCLSELIANAEIVGVAWGRTLRALIDGIEKFNRPAENANDIIFMPVCAELVVHIQRGYSATRLAELLDDIYNDGNGPTINMSGFPAFIPQFYDDDMRRAIKQFVSDTPSYARVFSGSDGLVHQMDTLISSVGSSQTPLLGALEELTYAGQLDRDQLSELIVGDLGGILIPKPDLSEMDKLRVEGLNKMWTGIQMQHVRDLARRAANNSNINGVVIVALQAERGETVLELIRLGLVNELIIDQAVADRLTALLIKQLD